MTKLFVVGFPRDMDEIELVELFSAYGDVESITIVTDKDTGISKGYGFIMMRDDAGAQRAIAAMNGATIDEREISVRIAESKQPANAHPVAPQSRPAPKFIKQSKDFIPKKRPRRKP